MFIYQCTAQHKRANEGERVINVMTLYNCSGLAKKMMIMMMMINRNVKSAIDVAWRSGFLSVMWWVMHGCMTYV